MPQEFKGFTTTVRATLSMLSNFLTRAGSVLPLEQMVSEPFALRDLERAFEVASTRKWHRVTVVSQGWSFPCECRRFSEDVLKVMKTTAVVSTFALALLFQSGVTHALTGCSGEARPLTAPRCRMPSRP